MGGAERFALRLARHATADRGYAVCLVCPGGSALAVRCRAAGIETVPAEFPELAPWHAMRQLPALAAARRLLALARARDAIVVANTSRTQAYVAAAATLMSRWPAIVHVAHEQDTAGRLTARLALPRVGALVAVGANGAATYRRAIRSATVDQLNNFLSAEEVDRLREGERHRQGSPRLGVIGRMIPEKGILELVSELASVSGTWADAVIAATPEDPAYEAAVHSAVDASNLVGRVRLLGHVDDVAGLLREVDVVVVPSTGLEGQPSVILEALAAGARVVVRRAVHSPDYEGMPVFVYTDAADLGAAATAAAEAPPVATATLLERFGPDQALDAIVMAARRAVRR